MAGTQNVGESSDNPVAINVTAMVDVIFCLCLFFMCSFHFKQVQEAISTWLPRDGIFPDGPPRVIAPDEVEVVLGWKDGATSRKVQGFAQARSDEDLVMELESRASDYAKAGNTTWKLLIDAGPDVPWQDVVHVMDLCKRHGIERIEFAAPRRPL